jgi:hypothetical protein
MKERRNILYIDGPLENKKGFIYEGDGLTFNKDITYYNTGRKNMFGFELWSCLFKKTFIDLINEQK